MSENDNHVNETDNTEYAAKSKSMSLGSPVMVNPAATQAVKETRSNFLSCGRCSLFLTSILIALEPGKFDDAVTAMQQGWIKLPWQKSMLDLLQQCFNFNLDITAYHVEGCCPECTRPFRYDNPDPEEPPTIQFKGMM